MKLHIKLPSTVDSSKLTKWVDEMPESKDQLKDPPKNKKENVIKSLSKLIETDLNESSYLQSNYNSFDTNIKVPEK